MFQDCVIPTGGGGGSAEMYVKAGDVVLDASNQTKITCGFKPKEIALRFIQNGSYTAPYHLTSFYNEADSTTSYVNGSYGTNAYTTINFGDSTGGRIYSVDNDGFTMNKYANTTYSKIHYIAVTY